MVEEPFTIAHQNLLPIMQEADFFFFC